MKNKKPSFLLIIGFPLIFAFYGYWKIFVLPPILKERDYSKYVSEYLQQTTDISLYPGYLLKENGRLFWCSNKPVLNDGGWTKINPVEVTGCVFDPFPYTSGDEKSLIEIKNKVEQKK